MARKRKPESSGASNAYLVSFGDTMTALLAFFIVLLSLADEQTGANLHAGSGSFIQAIKSFGLPGTLNTERTHQPFQKSQVGPLYIVGDGGELDSSGMAKGPDEEANQVRVIQRELDDFQRFLYEMEFTFGVEERTDTAHTSVFDLFDRLQRNEQAELILPKSLLAVLDDTVSVARDERYQVEVIVWATNPASQAMQRATLEADSIRKIVESRYRLSPAELSRFHFLGKSWMFGKEKRPTISLAVSKLMANESH